LLGGLSRDEEASSAPAAGRGRGRGRGRGSGSASADGAATFAADGQEEQSRKRPRAEEHGQQPQHQDRYQEVEDEKLAQLLGFGGFASTKGQLVESNVSTAARGGRAPRQARKYRQYMNRKGGFNQNLTD
jgi:U4/U6.U5 tri-snRNP-associated protein 3